MTPETIITLVAIIVIAGAILTVYNSKHNGEL